MNLQLRHEAEAAQIDTQHGHMVERRRAGEMEDRTITTKGDQQICRLDFLLQLQHGDTQLIAVAVTVERQAHHRFKADGLQDLTGLFCHLQLAVTIGVGTEDYFFHTLAPSFNVSWEAATTAARSTTASSSSDLRRYPKYSIFPSGPRMGE